MDGPVKTMEAKKFSFLDLDGTSTGINLKDKKKLIQLVIAITIFLGFYFAPLEFISKDTPKAVALAATVIYLWVTLLTDIFTTCIMMCGGAIVLGLLKYADIRTTFASSQFLPFMGICAVAVGATNTLLCTRFSYWLLWKIGKSPRLIIVCAVGTAGIISSSVSNIATGMLVGSIFAVVVEAVGDRDKLGRCVMICIGLASMYGGVMLPNGSSPNLVSMQNIAATTKDVYTISYRTWALLGWPVGLSILAFVAIFYPIWFKVPKRNENIDLEFFHKKLDELGPVTGAEIRWIILLLSMIGFMIANFEMGSISLIWMAMCCMPGIGIIPGAKLLKIMPWFLLFLIALSPLMAKFLGPVANYLVKPVVPMLSGFGVWGLMFFFAMFRSFTNSILVGSGHSLLLLMITIFAPICIALGYNPAVVMMPMFIISSPGVVFGASGNYQTTFQYGYWDIKDTMKPGLITMVVAPLISATVCYILTPMIGLSFMA